MTKARQSQKSKNKKRKFHARSWETYDKYRNVDFAEEDIEMYEEEYDD